MSAELKSLKDRLADLAEEHKKLKVLLSHKERLLESLEKEKDDALKIYTSSVEYTTEIFNVFNRGFEKSLEKVKEIQPDFPTHSILPPAKALAFKAMLKSNASASLQSDSVPPRDQAWGCDFDFCMFVGLGLRWLYFDVCSLFLGKDYGIC